MLPKTSPNYLQYKIHKCWLLSWTHFIVIIRVTTFECFKMQMVINLAPALLSNRKANFYTCPRLTFLTKNAMENAYKSIFCASRPQNFLGGAFPQIPLAAPAPLALETCLILYWSVAMALKASLFIIFFFFFLLCLLHRTKRFLNFASLFSTRS